MGECRRVGATVHRKLASYTPFPFGRQKRCAPGCPVTLALAAARQMAHLVDCRVERDPCSVRRSFPAGSRGLGVCVNRVVATTAAQQPTADEPTVRQRRRRDRSHYGARCWVAFRARRIGRTRRRMERGSGCPSASEILGERVCELGSCAVCGDASLPLVVAVLRVNAESAAQEAAMYILIFFQLQGPPSQVICQSKFE